MLPDEPAVDSPIEDTLCSCTSENCENKTCDSTSSSLYKRSISSFSFAFQELLADIGILLMVGFIIAGTITYFVPDGFIENNLGAGIKPMLIMLVIGIPLYVCATASTPIVAALAMKGLSPGAAIVFLLAGPATNAATITVIANMLGKKVAIVYVSTIAVVSLLIGYAVNSVYYMLSISISSWVAGTHNMENSFLTNAASILLILLVVRARYIKS
jgi:uncharacterized membrane protein YraQ (UPF0718 family)